MDRRAFLTLALTLAAVYVFWGSTAPAMRVAVHTLPPFAMAAIRFAIAGGILWLWVRLRGVPLPALHEWRAAAITGAILLVAGNAVFAWCLLSIPSGIGSLFFSLAPLWMALFGFVLFGERLSLVAWLGLALGLAGMIYLVSPGGAAEIPLVPMLAAVFTSIAWAFGSVLQRRFAFVDLLQASAMQMLTSSVMLVAIAALARERVSFAQFTTPATSALVFLIVCGSIVGYSCYLWLMRNAPLKIASTYAYVNPVVAIVIGASLLHEPLSWHTLLGGGIIILGVALMIVAPKAARSVTRGRQEALST